MSAFVVKPQYTRVTTAQRSGIVWGVGTLLYDTDLSAIYLGDGLTAGGVLYPALTSMALSWSGDQLLINGANPSPHLTGPTGPKGDTGDTGPAGPNSVSTSTASTITGVIAGSGGYLRQALAADVPDLSAIYLVVGSLSGYALQSWVTTQLGSYVPTSTTVNGHALSANVTITKTDVGLGSVENTALSTWAGSTSITTLGTIGTGTWQGSKIASGYLTVRDVPPFVLGVGAAPAAGIEITTPYPCLYAATVKSWGVWIGTNPGDATGGITIDLLKNGSTSVLSATLTIAAGTTGWVDGSTIKSDGSQSLAKGDTLVPSVSSVGSGVRNIVIPVSLES